MNGITVEDIERGSQITVANIQHLKQLFINAIKNDLGVKDSIGITFNAEHIAGVSDAKHATEYDPTIGSILGTYINMLPASDIKTLTINDIDWSTNPVKYCDIMHFYNELISIAKLVFSIRKVTSTWYHVVADAYYKTDRTDSLCCITTKTEIVSCIDNIPARTITESDTRWLNQQKYKNDESKKKNFNDNIENIKNAIPKVGDQITVSGVQNLINAILTEWKEQIDNNTIEYNIYTCHWVCHSNCYANPCHWCDGCWCCLWAV